MNSTDTAYRADIDGLRAMAVVSVVVFHAFPWLVPGGFVGVDVFFVISGFLITTNIVSGLERGTFTIAGFYDRRVRRIFPSLVTVLLATYALGWVSLFASEFRQLGKHIAGGAFFVSNLLLWAESGYFDAKSEVKPLVHLWSLGIEEQFYILWPLILWLTYKIGRRALEAATSLMLLSFVVGLTHMAGAGAYYSPLNRFWELLIGAILSTATLRGSRLPSNMRQLASIVGLVLVLVPMFTLDGSSSFPGWNALCPTLGAAILIASGPGNPISSRILGHRVMVGIGLISYPLYLWHWPLLVFARIIGSGVPPVGIRIGIVGLSVGLAYLTFRFIERPLRFNQRRRTVVVGLVGAMTLAGLLGTATFARDGLPRREFARSNVAPDAAGVRNIDSISKVGCGLQPEEQGRFADCRTDDRGPATYALIGDSKASALIGGFMRTSQPDRYWTIIGGTKGIESAVPLISSEPAYERFQSLIVPAVDTVASDPRIGVVVLEGAVRAMFEWPDFTDFGWLPDSPNYDKVRTALTETVRRLVGAGKKVVLYVDNPALAAPEDCTQRRTTIGLINSLLVRSNRGCSVPLTDFRRDTAKYRMLLDDVAREFPGAVSVFDPTDLLCDADRNICSHIKNGVRLYSYTDHPSDDAADLVGTRLNAYLAGL